MTQAAAVAKSGAGMGWRSNRRALAAAGVALAVLLLGTWSLDAMQRWWEVVMIKTPAPLSKPLQELPLVLGQFKRFHDVDRYLPPDEVAILGTEDYLLRDYVDEQEAAGTPGYLVSLNLNYYAVGSATPHVPRFCWAGNGMVEEGNRIITVRDVQHKDGTRSDVRMQLLWFTGKQLTAVPEGILSDSAQGAQYLNVAYMFQLNDGYVATAQEVTRHFWKPYAKYAYHTKIEVTVRQPCTPAEAEPVVARFIRASLAEIEKCLPDAKKLAAEASGAGVQVKTSTEESGH